MKELICRNCGAHNPAQSKFCNKCGASVVSQTTLICPNCESSNPIHLLYCDNCGTRLSDDDLPEDKEGVGPEESRAESRTQGFSLPSRPPGQTGNLDVSGEIPEWLRTGETESDDDVDDRIPEWWRAAQEAETWEDQEAPTLNELSDDHTPKDDLPTWLFEDGTADEILRSEKNTEELFSDAGAQNAEERDKGSSDAVSSLSDELSNWLDDLSEDKPTPSPPSKSADESFEAPDWLTQDDDSAIQSGTVEEDETADELESWLGAMEEADEDEAGEMPPIDIEDDEAPDWLSELHTEAEQEPAEDDLLTVADSRVEDWLVDTNDEAIEKPSDGQSDEADFQQWLAEVQDEQAFEEPSLTGEAESTSEWLDEEVAEGAADELEIPDWLTEVDDADLPDADLPDSELSANRDASTPAPEWLNEFADDEFEDEMLSFLSVLETEESETTPTASEEAIVTDSSETNFIDDEFESWLEGATLDESNADDQKKSKDHKPKATEPTVSDPELSDSEGLEDEEVTVEDDFLEWLASLDDSKEVANEEAVSAEAATPEAVEFIADEEGQPEAVSSDLPDWLSDIDSIDDGTEEAEAEALPGWLEDLAPSGTGPLPYLSTEGHDQLAEEADLPFAADDIDATQAELPDWLAGVSPELAGDASQQDEPFKGKIHADKSVEESRSEAKDQAEARKPVPADFDMSSGADDFDLVGAGFEASADSSLVPSDDLPDWFSDVMADIEVKGGPKGSKADQSSGGSGRLKNIPEQLAGSKLPDWLKSPFTSSDSDVAKPTPIEEIPDWLRPPMRVDAPSVQDENESLILGEMESSDEWTELLGALPPAERETTELSEAEIPPWLQALKPKALRGDDDVAPPAEFSEPEETEGPLTGLRGVIGIAPVVSQPHLSERTQQATLNKEQEQQAALLRQLAHPDTHAIADVEERKERISAAPWVRLLLAILLLGTVLTGLLVPNLLPAMTPVASGASFREAASMIDAVKGRPVLVAFEYTPALGGALNPLADAMLQRLAENNSPAILVSQSAAGMATAQQVAEGITDLENQELGYIPGGAIGLRRLASCLQSDVSCETPFGPTLDGDMREALAEAGLVIVMTGNRDDLVDWIEQVEASLDIPVLAVVTPAIVPVAAPYYSSDQLVAFSGPVMAEEEETMLSAQDTAVTLARWLVAAIMVLGALYYFVVGRGSTQITERKHE